MLLKSKYIVGLLVVLFALTGCSSEDSGLTDGSYGAASHGYGGEVSVELIVSKGRISEIEITGEDETPGVGQAAFKPLREAILEAQSVDVEGISGATRTSKAVLDAAEHALNKARGFEAEEITSSVLADGTYTAQTWSFSPNYPMEVSVGVKDNRFTSIEVIGGNDTEPILKSAEKLLIPRMIESQSVTMDAIAGATVSSNAIKTAVEACLVQSIEAAGGDKNSIQAFYTTGEKNNASARIQTDVLVVGMGGSGIVTAVRTAEKLYAAHDNNADAVRVLGIDKAGKYGGTSAVTSSPMSINPPSYVEKNGGEPFVDIDTLRSAWIEYTEGDAKDWAIDYMMFESGHASDWLAERGFEFGAPMQGLAYPYKAVVAYGGGFGTSKSEIGGYFDAIMEYYTSIGGEYMLETAAVDLLSDEKGNVIGVIAESYDGTQYEIYAEAVVLATGGFAGSADMTEKYLSTEFYPLTGDAYNVYGMMQNDGTMIEAAIHKGAATYNIGTPPISHIGGAAGIMHEFETTPIEGTFDIWTGREITRSLNDVPMMMAVAPNALAVNASGKRFADETFLGSYGNWMAGPRYYTIWSAEMIDEIKNKGFRFNTNGLFINQGGWPADTPIENIEEVLEAAIRHDLVVSADSLSALAPKLKMDSSTLETTVRQYNEYCETQTDPADGVVKNSVVLDFSGRPVESEHSTFQKVEGKGPYYAVVCSPWIYSTAGGLDINEQFQVLDKRGNAVKGLYAVGTDSIGVLLTEKKEYVGYGGAAQGWAFTSGYLTGEIIANDILKK